jgi:hypothetical protein
MEESIYDKAEREFYESGYSQGFQYQHREVFNWLQENYDLVPHGLLPEASEGARKRLVLKIDDDLERYMRQPVFRSVVFQILGGADPYDMIGSLIDVIEDQQLAIRKVTEGSIQRFKEDNK